MTQDAGSVPWRTDTAERLPRVVVPAEAPAHGSDHVVVTRPRWPLFADVAPDPARSSTGAGETGIGILEPVASRPAAPRRAPVLPWLAAAVVVALTAGVGGALVAQTQVPAPTTVTLGDPEALMGGGPEDGSDDERAATPSRDAARDSAEVEEPGPPPGVRQRARSVVADATASTPGAADPAVDVAGEEVTFGPENLTDGDTGTAWRTAGDGSDTVVTIDLGRPTWVTRVGLVNGYAKTAEQGGRTLDWYAGNRRVQRVDWFFDDGSREVQRLGRTRDLQTLDVPPVRTSVVRLRLTRVSAPGNGAERRDFTAISEVAVDGAPARRG